MLDFMVKCLLKSLPTKSDEFFFTNHHEYEEIMELSGKIVAEKIQQELASEVKILKSQNVTLSLAVILVGDDLASVSYIRAKENVARKIGVDFRLFHFDRICRESQVLELIEELNRDANISGIVVQLPLPENFDSEKIVRAINPKKDIDGLLGKMPAPTVEAILELLKFYKVELIGNIVLVGHGRLVGEPLDKVLTARKIDYTICDSKTPDLEAKTQSADLIISATGVPGLIKPDMVSKSAVVIDAGTAESGGSVKGDVDPAVYEKVRAYSPVPGGVGPLTVVMLMKNLVEAARKGEN